MLSRRRFLTGGTGIAILGLWPMSNWATVRDPSRALSSIQINASHAQLIATWKTTAGQHQVGVLEVNPSDAFPYRMVQAFDVPTRPHGLMWGSAKEVFVIARRPGDWIMRIDLKTGQSSRSWQTGRSLNGHCAMHEQGFYTTETDLLTGTGRVVRREPESLEVVDEWPTAGHDPHEMLVLPAGTLGLDESVLLVANGGIRTHADMGRTKIDLDQMDSSIVAMRLGTGDILKKWTLPQRLLSLRHMALHPTGVIGVAMQAQHAEAQQRNTAPTLALLSAHGLRTVSDSTGVSGYAGDIAAVDDGFVLSCTRSNAVRVYSLAGQLIDQQPAPQPCALASSGNQAWLGVGPTDVQTPFELDNHWLLS